MEELFTFPFDHNSSKEEQACMPKQTIERFPRWRLVSEESDVEDGVWVTDDELIVADGQANIFERMNQVFYFFV